MVVLSAQIRRAGMTPEWSLAPVSESRARPAGGQSAETDMLVDLWQLIAEQFSMSDMSDLAFELQLPAVHGDSEGEKARELVMCAKRHHRLEELRDVCRRERPEGGF